MPIFDATPSLANYTLLEVYIHMHTYMRTRTRIHVNARTHAHMHAHTRIHVHVHIHVNARTYAYAHACAHTHTRTCTCVNSRTHARTHTRTHAAAGVLRQADKAYVHVYGNVCACMHVLHVLHVCRLQVLGQADKASFQAYAQEHIPPDYLEDNPDYMSGCVSGGALVIIAIFGIVQGAQGFGAGAGAMQYITEGQAAANEVSTCSAASPTSCQPLTPSSLLPSALPSPPLSPLASHPALSLSLPTDATSQLPSRFHHELTRLWCRDLSAHSYSPSCNGCPRSTRSMTKALCPPTSRV